MSVLYLGSTDVGLFIQRRRGPGAAPTMGFILTVRVTELNADDARAHIGHLSRPGNGWPCDLVDDCTSSGRPPHGYARAMIDTCGSALPARATVSDIGRQQF